MAVTERPPYRTVLGKRNFDILLGGRGFSDFGDYFGSLALSWVVFTTTESAFALALTWIIFMVPRACVRLWGGVYVDRWNRRRIMLGTETTRAALFAIIAADVTLSTPSLPLIYTVAATVGGLGAVFDLASDALLPAVVEKKELLTANAIFQSVFQTNSITGPAAAGLTIYALGVGTSFLIDSFSFVVLVFALLMLVLPKDQLRAEHPPWFKQFREGFTYFKGRMELVMISVLTSGLNFGLGAFWYVYALIFADDVLKAGSFGYGLFGTASALGMLTGTVFLARRGRLQRRRLGMVVSLFCEATGITFVSFATNLPEALLPLVFFGVSLPFFDMVGTTYYQETVSKDMLGRALGFRRFIDFVSAPISILIGAFVVVWVGVADGILISGIVMFATAVAGIFAKSLKKLDQPRTS